MTKIDNKDKLKNYLLQFVRESVTEAYRAVNEQDDKDAPDFLKKDDEEEKVTIRGEEIVELAELREKNSTEMILALQKKDLTEEKLTDLKEQLLAIESGKCALRIQVHYPQKGTAHLTSHYRIKPTEEFLHHLEETFGRANVWSIT